jgi:hypothetical protein
VTELLKLREEMLVMAAAHPRMRRSTLWLLVVLGIALCGHPWTGAWLAAVCVSRCVLPVFSFLRRLRLSIAPRSPATKPASPLNAIASTFGMTGQQYLRSLVAQT